MSSKRERKQAGRVGESSAATAGRTGETTAVNESPWRYAIAGALVALFGIFYFTQDLFQVNNLNDFGEYMMRAQDWAAGKFVLTGGSDLLLSAIEYVALLAHPTDFMGFYSMTISILTGLTLAASFVFLVRTNPMLPDFWVRLGMTAIFLSIPHFIIATRTVDQTLLFGACLILWMATYDLAWAGMVGALTWFSRPEAIIVLPLFVVMYLLHWERRTQILINASSFVVILLLFKLLSPSGDSGASAGGYQQFGFLSKISWDWFVNLLSHTINIPILVVLYAMEALQNTLLVILFCLGIAVSVRQRSAFLMYATIVFFCFAYAVLAAEGEPGSYSSFSSIIRRMSLERDYFIVNAFNKFDAIIGHGRYRLVLYPAIAFFVINGLATVLRWFSKTPARKSYADYSIAAVSLLVAVYFLAGRYPAPSREFRTASQMEKMPPIMQAALAMRPHTERDARLYAEGFCDNSRGSFMSDFAVFSGVREFVLRVCPGTEFWQDGPTPIAKVDDYIREQPFNSGALMLFHDITARRSEITSPAFTQKLLGAASALTPQALSDAKISHVITGRDLQLPHLRRLGTFGNVRLYKVDRTKP